jgi:hypothetical protein
MGNAIPSFYLPAATAVCNEESWADSALSYPLTPDVLICLTRHLMFGASRGPCPEQRRCVQSSVVSSNNIAAKYSELLLPTSNCVCFILVYLDAGLLRDVCSRSTDSGCQSSPSHLLGGLFGQGTVGRLFSSAHEETTTTAACR